VGSEMCIRDSDGLGAHPFSRPGPWISSSMDSIPINDSIDIDAIVDALSSIDCSTTSIRRRRRCLG
jgi:hypothetical protein